MADKPTAAELLAAALQLTDEELKTVCALMVERAGALGVAEEDVDKVVAWAEDVRLSAMLLAQVLSGELAPAWDPAANDVNFALTDKGRARAEEVVRRLAGGGR